MLQKMIGAVTAVIMFLTSLTQMIFTPGVIRVDFDSIVGEMKPVHNIDRMPEYEPGSEINRYFTQANMTSCRTHDINCTDIHRVFPDFTKDAADESSYNFTESDRVMAAIAETGMEPFFRLGISYSDPVIAHDNLVPPADYTKWAQICEHIILHYNEGWADGYRYNIRYWEIWNEPENSDDPSDNHFWLGTDEEFFRLYDTAAKYLKEKFPALKIGGYGSCGFYALTKTNALNTGASERNRYFSLILTTFSIISKSIILRWIFSHGTAILSPKKMPVIFNISKKISQKRVTAARRLYATSGITIPPKMIK